MVKNLGKSKYRQSYTLLCSDVEVDISEFAIAIARNYKIYSKAEKNSMKTGLRKGAVTTQ